MRDGHVVLTNLSKHAITLSLGHTLSQNLGFIPPPASENEKLIYTFNEFKFPKVKGFGEYIAPFPPLYLYYHNLYLYVIPDIKSSNHPKLPATHYTIRGTYISAKDLESELNKNEEINKIFKFKYNSPINRFSIETIPVTESDPLKVNTYSLEFKNGLNKVLGSFNERYKQFICIL